MNPVLVDSDGAVRVITLNRPDKMNAINTAMRSALIEALQAANADDSVRAVVIVGAGERAFCAGVDLEEASNTEPERVGELLTHQNAVYQAVRDLDKGCVVAFNGAGVGGGFQIGLCADFRVGYPEMKIGQPEVKVGFASIVGSSLMAQHCTIGVNKILSLLGELIDGTRAYESGLLTHLVARESVRATAMDLARRLADIAPTAMRLTKERFGRSRSVISMTPARLGCERKKNVSKAASRRHCRRPSSRNVNRNNPANARKCVNGMSVRRVPDWVSSHVSCAARVRPVTLRQVL